jgi:hypothetical protein
MVMYLTKQINLVCSLKKLIMKTKFDVIEGFFSDFIPVVIGPSFWYKKFGFKFNDYELSEKNFVQGRKNLLGSDSFSSKDKGQKSCLRDNNILIYIPSPREQKFYRINFYPRWWKKNYENYQEIVDLESLRGTHFFKSGRALPGGWYLFRKKQCFNGLSFNNQLKTIFSFEDFNMRMMDIRRLLILLFLSRLNGTDCCLDQHRIRLNDLINPSVSLVMVKNGDGRFHFLQQKKKEIIPELGVSCFRSLT